MKATHRNSLAHRALAVASKCSRTAIAAAAVAEFDSGETWKGISEVIARFGNSTSPQHFVDFAAAAVTVAVATAAAAAAAAEEEEGAEETKFAKFAAATADSVVVEGQLKEKDEKEATGMEFAARDYLGHCFGEELRMSPAMVLALSLSKAWGSRLPSLTRSAWPPTMGPSLDLGIGGVFGRKKRKPFPP